MKAAMDYGRLGWSVVPVDPRSKASLIPWEVYQHRHAHTAEIGEWFTRWPNANLAIVTGVVSDLVVLDVDPRSGGETNRARLEQTHGPLPETVESIAGHGSHHIYFRHPGGILKDRQPIAPGICLHGDGSYVVAPPSVHASGERYGWIRTPDIFHLEPLPPWLSSPDEGRDRSMDPIAHCRHLSNAGAAQGQRRSAIASLTEHLIRNGVDPTVALQLMLCWNAVRCHPPLAIEAVIHTVKGIQGLHR